MRGAGESFKYFLPATQIKIAEVITKVITAGAKITRAIALKISEPARPSGGIS
jgi:hypothetical protein